MRRPPARRGRVFSVCVACSARMRAALDDLMTFATYAYYNTGSSFDLLRTRAKKAVCLITSWVSDRPFSLPYVSLRVAVPRGVSGAPNTIFASDSASLAPQSRRAHGRGRGVGGLGTQPVMTTCLAHTRGVARPPSAWKRARDDASPRPRRCREAASRRRPLFTTPRAGRAILPGGWYAKPSRATEEARDPAPRPC